MSPRGGFTWDAGSGRYRGARGRYVSQATLRRWLDVALDCASARIDALASQLRTGAIDLITWQVRMARELKNVQMYSAAAAKGGWAQLSASDLGRVGQAVRAQLEYLNGFAKDIRSGRQLLNGTLNMRARMYGQSGRSIFHRVERAEMDLRGYDQERSIRYSGDSCAGCIQEEARGWVPIGALVPIGQRDCKVNDRCRVGYRNTGTGAER